MVHLKKKDQQRSYVIMLMQCICVFSSNFLCKSIWHGHSFEMHHQVNAIQMSTHKIWLYEEVDKRYTGCNLKTTEFLDCALIGVLCDN